MQVLYFVNGYENVNLNHVKVHLCNRVAYHFMIKKLNWQQKILTRERLENSTYVYQKNKLANIVLCIPILQLASCVYDLRALYEKNEKEQQQKCFVPNPVEKNLIILIGVGIWFLCINNAVLSGRLIRVDYVFWFRPALGLQCWFVNNELIV